MSRLRDFLDDIYPHVRKGGRYEKFFGVYEMVDTFLYTPSDVNIGTTHIRDGIELKRTMTYVVIATFFCVWMAWFNTGYQANTAMAAMGLESAPGWRGLVLDWIGYNPSSLVACTVHGMLYFFPIYIVTLAVGGIWEVIFASVRKHDVNEGFLVSSILFALTMPPNAPLWWMRIFLSHRRVVVGGLVLSAG